MSENPLQETRFEMPVRVANLMRGSEERLCLEEGVERRWKTWFLCEMATIVLYMAGSPPARSPHFQRGFFRLVVPSWNLTFK